ncbi:hypothetical protein [Janibacter anophelis]|uniref:hypothetical protein n=1 Tax=Janibacter anophelis TaxID=319054 RepID=UPI000DEF533C|nr:hypothetical protein [Janibacter anophelis]
MPSGSRPRTPAASGATPRVVAGTTTEVHVSVWTTRTKGGSWRAVNVATGDVEASMARRAVSAALLSEPQVGA